MNRKRWPAVLGVVGIAVGVPSCNGGSKTKTPAGVSQGVEVATKDDLKALRDSLATLLSKDGTDPKTNLNKWLTDLANSVCQLEMKAPTGWGLDDNLRYCKKAGGGGDKIVPPPFPPK